jgi:hypothetical protein
MAPSPPVVIDIVILLAFGYLLIVEHAHVLISLGMLLTLQLPRNLFLKIPQRRTKPRSTWRMIPNSQIPILKLRNT